MQHSWVINSAAWMYHYLVGRSDRLSGLGLHMTWPNRPFVADMHSETGFLMLDTISCPTQIRAATLLFKHSVCQVCPVCTERAAARDMYRSLLASVKMLVLLLTCSATSQDHSPHNYSFWSVCSASRSKQENNGAVVQSQISSDQEEAGMTNSKWELTFVRQLVWEPCQMSWELIQSRFSHKTWIMSKSNRQCTRIVFNEIDVLVSIGTFTNIHYVTRLSEFSSV